MGQACSTESTEFFACLAPVEPDDTGKRYEVTTASPEAMAISGGAEMVFVSEQSAATADDAEDGIFEESPRRPREGSPPSSTRQPVGIDAWTVERCEPSCCCPFHDPEAVGYVLSRHVRAAPWRIRRTPTHACNAARHRSGCVSPPRPRHKLTLVSRSAGRSSRARRRAWR